MGGSKGGSLEPLKDVVCVFSGFGKAPERKELEEMVEVSAVLDLLIAYTTDLLGLLIA
jgi:hypothetical protein